MQRHPNNPRRYSVAALILTAVACVGFTALAVSPDGPLKELKNGNSRFFSGTPTHPNAGLSRVAETAGGQKPFAVVLACSDSRVPPELIFDRGVGDLFVVRDAGNVADPVVIGSIEYGVDHLHAPLVVVVGHTRCGAVEAAVSGYHGDGSIGSIIEKIDPVVSAVRSANPDLKGDGFVKAVVEANVRNSIADLLQRSKKVSEALRAGKISIVGAIYDVSDGRVTWLTPEKPASDHPPVPWGD